MTRETPFIIRLSVRDHEAVKNALEKVGADGERALKRISAAARETSGSTKALSTAMSEARSRMDEFAAAAGPLGSVMSAMGPWGLAAAAGIGAAVAGMARLMSYSRQAARTFDEINDAADRLNIGVEVLQELQYAALQNNIAAEQLTGAIERLRAGLSQLASGETTDVTLALRRLGMTAADATAPIERSMAKLADGLRDVQSQAERVDLARAIFGKQGGQLLAMLQDGADKLAALRQEARDLGIVIDESIIRRGGEAADRLEALSKVIDLQLKAAIIDLAPVLAHLSQRLAEVASWVARVIDSFRALEDRTSAGLRSRIAGINEELATLERRLRAAAPQDEFGHVEPFGRAQHPLEEQRQRLLIERERLLEEIRRREAEEAARQAQRSEAQAVSSWRAEMAGRAGGGAAASRMAARPVTWRGYVGPALGSFRAAQEVGLDEAEQLSRDVRAHYAEMERLRQEDQRRADEYARRLKETLAEPAREAAREYEIFSRVMADVFADIITGGEITAQSLIRSFQRVLLSTAVQELMGLGRQWYSQAGGIGGIFRMLGGGGRGFSAPYGTATGQTSYSSLLGMLGGGVAEGAAWGVGGVRYLGRGGIIGSPMVFGEASGLTVAGEAGAEVVAPLRRDASGNLGVGALPARVEVVVNNYSGATVDVRREGGGVAIDIDRAIAGVLGRTDGMARRALAGGYIVRG